MTQKHEARRFAEVRGFAKINLFLDVTGRRADGYHLVNMAMQSLDLCDTVRVELTEKKEGDLLVIEDPEDRFSGLTADGDNLVLRAAGLFRKEFPEALPEEGLLFTLTKRIPMEAGLAGGSADAAAALIGMTKLALRDIPGEALAGTALSLGADVPYCLQGGMMRAQGIGEVLSPLTDLPDCAILLVKPVGSASTREIYTALDGGEIAHPDWDRFAMRLAAGDLAGIAGCLSNVLEPVTTPMIPDIVVIREKLLKAGALGARMTGSGSVVYGIFSDEGSACKAMETIRQEDPLWDVRFTHPLTAEEVLRRRVMEEIR